MNSGINPDMAIQVAGALAMIAAVGHGYLGDKQLAVQNISPPSLKPFLRCCYQFGSMGWLVGGVLLLLTPAYFTGQNRTVLVYALIPMFLFGSIVNAWFTRLRHMGWVMLFVVVVLAIMGT